MKRKYLHTLEIEISEIKANNKFYWFDYILWIDGKKKIQNKYESDHSWGNNRAALIKMLEKGEAVKLILEQEL